MRTVLVSILSSILIALCYQNERLTQCRQSSCPTKAVVKSPLRHKARSKHQLLTDLSSDMLLLQIVCRLPFALMTYIKKTNTPSIITSANNFQVGCCTAGSSCSDGYALPTACIPWISMDLARFGGGYACTWDAAIPYRNRYTFSDPDYEFFSCGPSSNSVNTNFLWPYQWSALYGERLAATTSFETLPTSMPDPGSTSSKFAQPTGSPSVASGTMSSGVRQRSERPSAAVVAGAAIAAVIGAVILCASVILIQRRKARRQGQSGGAEVSQSKPAEPDLEREKALVHELPAKDIFHLELDGTTIA